MKKISDLECGKAGEHLVCADLILKGYKSFLTGQGLSYDVVVDMGDRLIRVQVKTTRKQKAVPQRKSYTPAYLFNIRKMGKGGRKSYNSKDVDVFALVALDRRRIGYVAETVAKQSMVFRIREFEGKYYDEKNKEIRKIIMDMHDSGKTYKEIGETLDIGKANAWRMANRGGTQEYGIYLDTLSFENAIRNSVRYG